MKYIDQGIVKQKLYTQNGSGTMTDANYLRTIDASYVAIYDGVAFSESGQGSLLSNFANMRLNIGTTNVSYEGTYYYLFQDYITHNLTEIQNDKSGNSGTYVDIIATFSEDTNSENLWTGANKIKFDLKNQLFTSQSSGTIIYPWSDALWYRVKSIGNGMPSPSSGHFSELIFTFHD